MLVHHMQRATASRDLPPRTFECAAVAQPPQAAHQEQRQRQAEQHQLEPRLQGRLPPPFFKLSPPLHELFERLFWRHSAALFC